jgi:flagellar basal body-associated protein FliL
MGILGANWRTGVAATCAILFALSGCGSRTAFEFDALDSTPAQDEMAEVSLGHYAIPIPIAKQEEVVEGESRNRLVFAFDLFALVSPNEVAALNESRQRHEGNVRDCIIRICRNASVEELQEPDLSTLKSHLTDAVQEELGVKSIHRLLVSEVSSKEI